MAYLGSRLFAEQGLLTIKGIDKDLHRLVVDFKEYCNVYSRKAKLANKFVSTWDSGLLKELKRMVDEVKGLLRIEENVEKDEEKLKNESLSMINAKLKEWEDILKTGDSTITRRDIIILERMRSDINILYDELVKIKENLRKQIEFFKKDEVKQHLHIRELISLISEEGILLLGNRFILGEGQTIKKLDLLLKSLHESERRKKNLKLQIKEIDHNGIKEVMLKGDIPESNLRKIIEGILKKYGITGHEENYLLRGSRYNKEGLIRNGVERDDKIASRDLDFERKFNRGPDGYTYCYFPQRYNFIEFICSDIIEKGEYAIFYKRGHLTQQWSYDKIGRKKPEIGTGTLFSFNYPNKRQAVYLIISHEGKII